MNSSLDLLSTNLQTEDLVKTSRSLSDSELASLRRNGVYPYKYVDSYERFDKTKLPANEAFYSQLFREYISDADYQHAQLVWEAFECKTLGDYHDIFADRYASSSRRLRSVQSHAIATLRPRPCTILQRVWNVMGRTVKKTTAQLELLTDVCINSWRNVSVAMFA